MTYNVMGSAILPDPSAVYDPRERILTTPDPAKSLTYRDAGVDMDAGDQLVENIKPLARKTMRPEVLAGIGGFGALCSIPAKYREPVMVSGTDGVGTKLKLAFELNRHDTIGIDLVAMSVNDILVQGAEPLFFLDYFACGKLDVATATDVVKGIAAGCGQAGCALIGGETAEMPGMYPAGEYDLAGFAVGVVEKSKIIDGKALSDLILAPTRIYVKPLLQLMAKLPVKGMAHITGGGIVDNVPRILPAHLTARLTRANWPQSPFFAWLQREGNVDGAEMLRVFNCGIGMAVIVAAQDADAATILLSAAGETVYRIGSIEARAKNEAQTIVT